MTLSTIFTSLNSNTRELTIGSWRELRIRGGSGMVPFFTRKKSMIIAIDGPAGAGKSTIARILSERLEIEYIDSGAMYRALTYYGQKTFGEVKGRESEIAAYFSDKPRALGIGWTNHEQQTVLNGDNVSREIRNSAVTAEIKYVANRRECREVVNRKMRELARDFSFVIDGRDIGTVVFPDAENKFYLDADPVERARRRARDLNISEEEGLEFEELLKAILQRDEGDMNREIAPLKKADDAMVIDTSPLSIEQVVEKISALIKTTDSHG